MIDPSEKAVRLAAAISEALNCAAFSLLVPDQDSGTQTTDETRTDSLRASLEQLAATLDEIDPTKMSTPHEIDMTVFKRHVERLLELVIGWDGQKAAVEKLGRAGADFLLLSDLINQFQGLGYDVVEMMLADQDSWDRYTAAQWLNIRSWLDQNPHDELAPELREELTSEPARYAASTSDHLGWGVFALMKR